MSFIHPTQLKTHLFALPGAQDNDCCSVLFKGNSKEMDSLSRWVCPTFADILVLQPQLSLDLFVGVPDGAGLLEAVHCLLHIVVPELFKDGDKVAPLRCPVQRMDGRAEPWVDGRKRERERDIEVNVWNENKNKGKFEVRGGTRIMYFVCSAVLRLLIYSGNAPFQEIVFSFVLPVRHTEL